MEWNNCVFFFKHIFSCFRFILTALHSTVQHNLWIDNLKLKTRTIFDIWAEFSSFRFQFFNYSGISNIFESKSLSRNFVFSCSNIQNSIWAWDVQICTRAGTSAESKNIWLVKKKKTNGDWEIGEMPWWKSFELINYFLIWLKWWCTVHRALILQRISYAFIDDIRTERNRAVWTKHTRIRCILQFFQNRYGHVIEVSS